MKGGTLAANNEVDDRALRWTVVKESITLEVTFDINFTGSGTAEQDPTAEDHAT